MKLLPNNLQKSHNRKTELIQEVMKKNFLLYATFVFIIAFGCNGLMCKTNHSL